MKKAADNKANPTTTISPNTTSVANTDFPNRLISSGAVIITLFLFKEQNHIYL